MFFHDSQNLETIHRPSTGKWKTRCGRATVKNINKKSLQHSKTPSMNFKTTTLNRSGQAKYM
jgi:hypothetical protein